MRQRGGLPDAAGTRNRTDYDRRSVPKRVRLFVGRLLHLQVSTTVTKLLPPAPVRILHQFGGKTITVLAVPAFVSLPSRMCSHQFKDIHKTIGTIAY